MSTDFQLPFSPTDATMTLAVTSVSANAQVLTAQPTIGLGRTLRLVNVGPSEVFLAFGTTSGVTATTAGMSMLPGTVEIFGGATTWLAAITAAGTSTLRVTPGRGV